MFYYMFMVSDVDSKSYNLVAEVIAMVVMGLFRKLTLFATFRQEWGKGS